MPKKEQKPIFTNNPPRSGADVSDSLFQQQTKEGEANSLLQENRDDSSWMVKKMKELKEYSELVAGPKWKNLVRKIGKYCNPKKSSAKTQFQYDSDSYALNFDDAGEDDDGLLHEGFRVQTLWVASL
ncbi:hypothetical protein HAX54_013837 [Datura stramonium]|uniref:Uncharacterized protein n=1 Tax=Datura stramonium TaxID=4076 RepID=A0ABS8TNT6_DATST|nr:hypothetical protein [Datura stramonium]